MVSTLGYYTVRGHCWFRVTLSSDVFVFSGVFDNVKPVNEPRMCSFNVEASLCVGDANVVVSIYILVVFLDRRSFALLCFSSSAFLPFCADECVRGSHFLW